MNELTLYQISENITALLDTEVMVTDPLQQAELQTELAKLLAAEVQKVDGFAGYIRQLETAVAFLKDRKADLNDRQKAIENRIARLEKYAAGCIEVLPRNAKGGYARLEGKEFTLSLRAPKESVDITDEQKVPSKYKVLTIKVSAEAWEQHITRYNEMRSMFADAGNEPLSPCILGAIINTEVSVTKIPIADDLKSARKRKDFDFEIPGAELKFGDPTLQVS